MLSSYEVLPSHDGVISGIPIPIIVTVEPLSSEAAVLEMSDLQIPRCTRCRSYISSVCAVSPEAWCCSVCSQIMHLSSPVDSRILERDVVEVVQSAEEQPLDHVLMIFTPIQKDVIRDMLKLLPERAPLTVITRTVTPTASVGQILEELDDIEFPESNIPFEEAVQIMIESWNEFMSPSWVRVLIETPPFSLESSPLLQFMNKQHENNVRIDFYFTGTSFSKLLSEIIQQTPGLSKVFHPITESDLPGYLLADVTRGFAMQLLAVFRSGVAYSGKFLSSPFLKSEECEGFVRIPVLPADTACLEYEIMAPQVDAKLRMQAMQCVVKYTKWNPKTNRLSRLFRIVSHEFKVSNSLSRVIDSVSPSVLFYSWLKEVQKLPSAQMTVAVQKKLSQLAPVLAANKHLKSIVLMSFLSKSHPALSTADWERLTMGSLLSLSSPAAVEAQFSYVVELWKNCNEFVEASFVVDERKRTKDYIFVVKSFPSVVVVTATGDIDIPDDSPLAKSISTFVDKCKPLTTTVVKSQLSQVAALLSVDEEEGLSAYLKDVGLEEMEHELV